MQMTRRDLFSGVLVTLVWGCNFSVIEWGLQSVDPYLMTVLRFLFCAIPLIFFMPRPEGISYRTLVLYGTLFGAGLWWVVNFAIHNGLSAGMSSVFLQFSAFFTMLLSTLLLREPMNGVHMAGIVIASTGLAILLLFTDDPSTIAGVGLVLLAALAWSLCNLLIKIKRPKAMLAFMVWTSAFAVPVMAALTIAIEGWQPVRDLKDAMTWQAGVSILFQSYVTTIAGYAIWNSLMKKYPAAEVAPLSLLVPVTGMLASAFFFEEVLAVHQVVAILIVLSGVGVFLNAGRLLCLLEKRLGLAGK